ncbi:MAG: hypothetical protein RL186_201 [Pseudomonadota bacterium]
MIGQCTAPRPELGLVRGLLETVDCNIREGVHGGYNALLGPGSPTAALVTVLLTIYVALLGFRLLTGRTDLRVGDLPVIAIKLGAVVMLTTSWASYQNLVFRVLFDGPAEIANSLLSATPLPQTTNLSGGYVRSGDVYGRLQVTFDQLTQSAKAMALVVEEPAGEPSVASAGIATGNLVVQAAPGTDPNALKAGQPVVQVRSALQGGPSFGATALWLSAIVLLVSTLGLVILTKLMLGLLLAIGPLFVGLLLFDATRGFFEGWLRTSLGFALAPLATVIFTAGLLASLEPSLQGLAVARAANRYAVEPVVTILVIVLTFTAVFGSVVGLCTRLVAGFRLPEAKPRPQDALSASGAAAGGRASGFAAEATSSDDRIARLANIAGQESGGDRRDARIAAAVASQSPDMGQGNSSTTTLDRRTDMLSGVGSGERSSSDVSARLGQVGRRRSNPVRAPRVSLAAVNNPNNSRFGASHGRVQ